MQTAAIDWARIPRLTGQPLGYQLPKIRALHPKQQEFILSPLPHVAFIGGRGSGKTWGGAYRAVRAAYGYIGQDRVIPTPNLGMVTAPTYKLLQDGSWRAFRDIAGGHIKSHSRSSGLTTLNNGSEILWRSMDDPDKAVRGPSISWWWGDEAAQYTGEGRQLAVAMLRQFGQTGYEWLTTTPRGRNWLWQIFVRDHGDAADHHLLTASSFENAFLGEGVVANFARDYHGDFRAQEIEGAFVAYAGLVYPMFDHAYHIVDDHPPHQRVIAGVDWGYANAGVILYIYVDGDGRVHVAEEVYEAGRTLDSWAERAHAIRGRFGVDTFFCDPSDPEGIAAFQRRGLNAVEADNDVLPGIHQVQNKIGAKPGDGRPRFTIHRACVNTIQEFDTYQWAENKNSEFRDAPLKRDDHAMDALRYAIMGLALEGDMRIFTSWS